MKKVNVLIVTLFVLLFISGCVKPTQQTQAVYSEPVTTQPVYEEAQPIIYDPNGGGVYEEVQPDGTVITTGASTQPVGTATTYPDPYATGGVTTTPSYPDPYASQPVISDYPSSSSSYPTVSSSSSGGGLGGIHLQIAALKDYYTAEDYKNRLSLPPGLTAYVQRGAMNKVIVAGIPSVAEANRLKETRFPGAFIVKGASSGGYTPPVQPNYDTLGGGAYSIDNPYGSSSVSSGIGVQIGAFSSQAKAQSVANSQTGQYPAIVKKIGKYYKVILTGFSSRSAAKAYASRVGGFVVDVY